MRNKDKNIKGFTPSHFLSNLTRALKEAASMFLKSKHSYSRKSRAGFTIIELLVALLVFGILATAALSGFSALARTVKSAREKTVLSTLASQYLEIVRNMPFSEVGTENGNPSGGLADFTNAVVVQIESFSYKIYYEVTFIDDPADGTVGGSPNDPAPADYKQVKMNVLNVTTGQVTTFVTSVVPKGLEGTTNAGAIRVRVFNFSGQAVEGANVHIEYPTSSPSIILDRQTDALGQWIEVGLPQATNNYKIVVTKNGYTQDQTYPITAQNPSPVKPHATVANGQVTDISFTIDTPAALNIRTLNQFCQNVSGVNVNVRGSRLIGTSPDVFRYNQDHTSSGGQVTLTNIEWDTYIPTLLINQSWVIRGTSPIQQIDVLPGTTQTFNMILAEATDDSGEEVDPPWFNEWGYRRKITIDRTKVSGSQDLTDFPMLFSATANEFRYTGNGGKMGKSDGTDMVFTTSDGVTKIPYEIERYTASSGQILAWVRVPTISPNTNEDIYLYYGNAAATDQQQKTSVWSSGSYEAVYHLPNGTTLSQNDSTSNARNATAYNTPTPFAGQIDGAADFVPGSSEYMDTGYADNIGMWTITAWVRGDNAPGNASGSDGPVMREKNYQFVWDSPTSAYRGAALVNTPASGWKAAKFGTLNANTWYYLTATFDGSNLRAYRNGQLQNTTGATGTSTAETATAKIAKNAAANYYFDGKVDEVRIASEVRSVDWMRTEYNNQSSPVTFYTIGAEQAYTPPVGTNNSLLVIVKDAATGAALENVSLHLHKGGGSPVDYYGVTGGSVWLQNTWSSGSGQDLWNGGSQDRYAADDGNIDVTGVPTGVRLVKTGSVYVNSGWLESSTFDTGTNQSQFTTFTWEPSSQQQGASVRLQLASSNSEEGPWNYVGPDGTAATYYTAPGTNISNIHDGEQYIRYKAYLDTTNTSNTPVLSSVTFNYVSGCFTPGQYWFGELTIGSNYTLEASSAGYQDASEPLNINGHQGFEILMSP